MAHYNGYLNRVINEWNNLPDYIVNAKTINEFKNLYDKHTADSHFNLRTRVAEFPASREGVRKTEWPNFRLQTRSIFVIQ